MKVRIQRQDLLTALQRVQGVVEKRNTMPILANILLEAKSEGLDILATDLELAMRGLYKATVDEPGSVTFSARKLFEILKEIREQEIQLHVADNSWVTIKAGRSEFRVVGLPSQDYPSLPAIERDGLIPLPAAGLLELIRRTIFAVGDNDTRYVLNGVLVSIMSGNAKTATLRLVGTDGHRLAMAEEEVVIDQAQLPAPETKVIIPKKAAIEIRRLLEEDDNEPLIGFTKNMVIFRKSGLVLTSRVMEGAYPNYQQVMPKESPQKIKISKDEFEGAIRRVSLLSKDKSYAIKLSFTQDRIHLSSSNPDLGEANEEISAEHQGEDFSTGFNARYLLDVLGAIEGESLTLQMETPLSPCLIQEFGNPKFKAVVMPVKV
ncbi:MAG: DNA polymerase III subunit beta [Nitrospirales bacterium]|nr:MAG: DNA polymerase III subunit beta [Nitrospirales bacterium]